MYDKNIGTETGEQALEALALLGWYVVFVVAISFAVMSGIAIYENVNPNNMIAYEIMLGASGTAVLVSLERIFH